MDDKFNQFLESVDRQNQNFVLDLNKYLTDNNCKCDIKTAKSGFVVSYILCETKRTLATFVFRKSGVKLRIYPEHIAQYENFLEQLPEKMKKDIRKASVCKRLLDPNECNPRCVMGYCFTFEEELYKKCRYMAFQPTLSEENNPYIKEFLEKELLYREFHSNDT